jgi:putative hydrolase of the HAD superfamily
MRPDLLEAVCFDIGGTLVEMERGTLAEEIAVQIDADQHVVKDLLIQHGKRTRTTPAQLAAVITLGCRCPQYTGLVAELLNRRRTDVSSPRLYGDTLATLQALTGAGWRIFYLSNAVGYVDAGPAPGYYCYAEIVLHSWEIGACTPDPAAYRAIADRSGLDPETILHVGDSWDSDIVGALDAGWQAVHLARAERDVPVASLPQVPRIGTLTDLIDLLPAQRQSKTAKTTVGEGT